MSILHYLKNMKTDTYTTNDKKGAGLSSSEHRNDNHKGLFHSNAIDVYDVFTDGSEIKHSKTHKTLAVGWSFVIFKNKVLFGDHSDCIHNVTLGNNQRAELMALNRALQRINHIIDFSNNPCQITIYTDSEYSMKSLTIWCHTWKHNGWKTANKKPVKHKDLIEQSMQYMNDIKKNGHSLSIFHVRAHTERKDYISLGNSHADRLAQSAAKKMLKEQDNKI